MFFAFPGGTPFTPGITLSEPVRRRGITSGRRSPRLCEPRDDKKKEIATPCTSSGAGLATGLEEDFGAAGTVADDHDITTALQAVQGRAGFLNPH